MVIVSPLLLSCSPSIHGNSWLLGTLPETNIFAPENGWLVQIIFLLGWLPGRCELLVSGSVPETFGDIQLSIFTSHPSSNLQTSPVQMGTSPKRHLER